MKIAILDPAACDAARDQLAGLLLDALASGPALGFWPGLGPDAARRYWREVGSSVEAGSRVLVAAIDGAMVVAAGQLVLSQPPQPDSAEVRSMLVHSSARRRGIGSVLVRALEAEASARRCEHLFLDTEPGSNAEVFCLGLGYDRAEGLAAIWPTAARYRKTLLIPEAA